jgi:hypothetical protein
VRIVGYYDFGIHLAGAKPKYLMIDHHESRCDFSSRHVMFKDVSVHNSNVPSLCTANSIKQVCNLPAPRNVKVVDGFATSPKHPSKQSTR